MSVNVYALCHNINEYITSIQTRFQIYDLAHGIEESHLNTTPAICASQV